MEIGSMLRLRIGFYGAGRVGCTLGRYFRDHGLLVTGFYNRTPEKAREAAGLTGTLCYETLSDLIKENDVLFLTVSDQAIPMVTEEVCHLAGHSLKDKFLVHTSGALSSTVFASTGAHGYSIHPLYAVANRENSWQTIDRALFTVEGDPEYLELWTGLLGSIGLRARVLSTKDKPRYHAAAVMASNLVCGLFDTAAGELRKCGFAPEEADEALSGLFLGNAVNIAEHGTVAALTGPVERGDGKTVQKHLDILEGQDQKIYLALSRKVLEVAERKNPGRDYSELKKMISEETEGGAV